MIARYSRKPMVDIWEEHNKFQVYLDIELIAAEAWSELGDIPKADVAVLYQQASFDIDRIHALEKETKHDIVAFTRAVSETLGEEKKWVHYGLTSTDVVDTANGVLLKQANTLILEGIDRFIQILKDKALLYKHTPCIGRTHGVHADITSFGLKWALWFDEMNRQRARFLDAASGVEIGKISGAVGNFANVPPFIQDYVCEKLGIASAAISTQTIQRDRHAHYLSSIALIGATIEKIATEIRHLQRTEVREVEEYFSAGQTGSSAMPHKRNPIASENVCGIARVLRGYMVSSFENIALWHERDISHSSVERIILPDATTLLDYMLNRYANVCENLVVNKENMLKNIYSTHHVIFSQRVLTALIKKQRSREDAYKIVQTLAMQAWQNQTDFKVLVQNSEEISTLLSPQEIDNCFDLEYYLSQVDTIYQRVKIEV